ncbi:phospholipase D family protein [Klebsiella oxytoca]|uniref:phospholipase D n=2 Tax=Klebsiella oxytoca TaxID=571 RepID=A0AAP2FLN6_KLEOX|nr:phospholipase D family protein [Klebsiella oxytoca]
MTALIGVLISSPVYPLGIGDLVDSAKKVLSKDSETDTDQNSHVSTSNTYRSDVGESSIAIGFSPEGSAQKAILDLIGSAQKEIRLSAYSFTSPEVVKALTQAKRRGVDVKLVVDYKGNTGKLSVAAMNLIVNAGIPIRTIQKYAIHHDKFIVVDRVSVETGSFNYSRSANLRNSENVIVLYNMPQVATQYLNHWTSRWNDGKEWESTY